MRTLSGRYYWVFSLLLLLAAAPSSFDLGFSPEIDPEIARVVDAYEPEIEPDGGAFERKQKAHIEERIRYYTSGRYSRHSVNHFTKEVGNVLGQTVAVISSTAMLFSAAAYVYPAIDADDVPALGEMKSSKNGRFEQAVIGGLMTMGKTIGDAIWSGATSRDHSLREGLQQVHKDIMASTEADMTKAPAGLQGVVTWFDTYIADTLASGNIQTLKQNLKEMLEVRQTVFLPFAMPAMNLIFSSENGHRTFRDDIDANVGKLLEQYAHDENTFAQLAAFVHQARINSFAETPEPAALYLEGPAGTGKTTFVRKLGRALGVHVCEINLSTLPLPMGFEGTSEWITTADKASQALGKVVDCIRRAGHANPIIFFDEAGDVLGYDTQKDDQSAEDMNLQRILTTMKSFFSNLSEPILSQALHSNVRLDRVTFILAGNRPIVDPPLKSRLGTVRFDRLSEGQKVKALVDARMRKLRDPSLTDLYGDEFIANVKEISDRYLPTLLAEDAKRFPGGRILKKVYGKFFDHVLLQTRTARKLGTPVDERTFESFIIAELEQH